jgi:hypothetical protein
MTKLKWDQVGEREYETGVEKGVLYVTDDEGAYGDGVAWNGLTTVTESPSGADSNKQYADNQIYLDLRSAELFGGTIEAFTYPDEFEVCDGVAEPSPGVLVTQQRRQPFGLCYRTKIGSDVSSDHGSKIHLVYGATATPSEKAYATINDSPSAIAFSWTITTIPVEVSGLKPTSLLVIDSTRVDADAFAALENIVYGTDGTDARLPMPDEVIALFSGTVTTVATQAPTYDDATHTITIPTVAGVTYEINGEAVSGDVVITEDTVVEAVPTSGHVFSNTSDSDWSFEF